MRNTDIYTQFKEPFLLIFRMYELIYYKKNYVNQCYKFKTTNYMIYQLLFNTSDKELTRIFLNFFCQYNGSFNF